MTLKKTKKCIFFLAVVMLTQIAPHASFFPQAAKAAFFQDVTQSDPYFTAIEALKKADIIGGYEDGTFQPDKKINRAEALKIILRSAQKEPEEGLFDSGFSDVPINAWYAGYVMIGVQQGFIAGNPDKTFTPQKNVNRAEFLKMTLGAFGTDISRHKNITQGIAPDVPAQSWFIPYMSYARTIGLVYPDLTGALHPSQEMTRGECAFMLYKLLLIEQNGEAQKNLSMAEAQLVAAGVFLHQGNISAAVEAVNGAEDLSHQSYKIFTASTAAEATWLMSQAFQKLMQAYEKAEQIQSGQNAAATSSLIEDMKKELQQARDLADQATAKDQSIESFHKNLTHYANILAQP